MCGRFVTGEQAAIEREFAIVRPFWKFAPSWNVAPSQPVPVIITVDGARTGTLMRWGLVPYWADGVPPRFSTINATVEKLQTSPLWRSAWKRAQRCIMPASGFYEWHQSSGGGKFPYLIRLSDQALFGFAALWDRSRAASGDVIESCALITLPANELLREVHNAGANPYRMPATLTTHDREAWLSGSAEDALAALTPYPSELMIAYQVSSRVNSTRNDDASLIAPVI